MSQQIEQDNANKSPSGKIIDRKRKNENYFTKSNAHTGSECDGKGEPKLLNKASSSSIRVQTGDLVDEIEWVLSDLECVQPGDLVDEIEYVLSDSECVQPFDHLDEIEYFLSDSECVQPFDHVDEIDNSTQMQSRYENESIKKRNWTIPTNEKYDDNTNTRSFTVKNIEVTLQIKQSTILNAGEGLFLSFDYIKNNHKKNNYSKTWTVPKDGVVLGTYGTGAENDMKQEVIFDAKNFIFEWKLQEWSFRYDDHFILDVTDKEGEMHINTVKTLLPKVNELDEKNDNEKIHIDMIFHNHKVLFILRGKIEFKQGKSTELFTCYGNSYKDIRERKYGKNDDTRGIQILAVPSFISMFRRILVYTIDDVRNVLDYFLNNTPTSSEARCRMVWAAKKILIYCGEALYNDEVKEIPSDIKQKVSKILLLFPQKNNKEDYSVYEKNKNMGLILERLDDESNSKVSGMVEKEICSNKEHHKCLRRKYIVFRMSDLKLEVWKEGRGGRYM